MHKGKSAKKPGDWFTYAKITVQNETTPVGIGFELRTSQYMDEADITYVKNPIRFKLDYTFEDGTPMTFRPDYSITGVKFENQVTDITMGGKEILLEPHGSKFFSPNFLIKLRRFMESEYHKLYHLIVLTDDKYKDYIHSNLASLKLSPKDIADELWLMRETEEVKGRFESLKRKAEYATPAARNPMV